MAAEIPRMFAVMRVLMARPAASSFAELMRIPEDKRSIAVDWLSPVTRKEFCAAIALMFVLITVMGFLLQRFFKKFTRNPYGILLTDDSVATLYTLEIFKIIFSIQAFELKKKPFIRSMLCATRTTTSLGICLTTSPVDSLTTVTTGEFSTSSIRNPKPRLVCFTC